MVGIMISPDLPGSKTLITLCGGEEKTFCGLQNVQQGSYFCSSLLTDNFDIHNFNIA